MQDILDKIVTLLSNLLLNIPNISVENKKIVLSIAGQILSHDNVIQGNIINRYHTESLNDLESINLEVETIFFSTDLLAHCILSYTLFYFFNPTQANFLLDESLEEIFIAEYDVKLLLFELLIKFFEKPDGGIKIKESEKIVSILGKEFYDEFLNVVNKRMISNNFNIQVIEYLLKD